MASRKGRVAGELVYLQMCAAVDSVAIRDMHVQLQRSVDFALYEQMGADGRQRYARRLMRRAWQRIGEIVIDGPPSIEGSLDEYAPP